MTLSPSPIESIRGEPTNVDLNPRAIDNFVPGRTRTRRHAREHRLARGIHRRSARQKTLPGLSNDITVEPFRSLAQDLADYSYEFLRNIGMGTAVQSMPANPGNETMVLERGRLATIPHVLGTDAEEMLDMLRASKFRGIAERLDHLNAEVTDDPDFDVDQIHEQSVENFGNFLLTAEPSAMPMVGVHPAGYVFAQWRVVGNEKEQYWGDGDGILSVIFEPSHLVRYAASSGPEVEGIERISCSGIMPTENFRAAMDVFFSRVADYK